MENAEVGRQRLQAAYRGWQAVAWVLGGDFLFIIGLLPISDWATAWKYLLLTVGRQLVIDYELFVNDY